MAYTQVPDPNLDVGKPVRSVDIKQLRDNQDDFDSRIMTLENPSVRAFSHFDRRTSSSGDIVTGQGLLAKLFGYLNKFTISHEGTIGTGGSMKTTELIGSAGSDEHALQFDSNVGTGTDNHDFYLYADQVINWDNRTKPVQYEVRTKVSDLINSQIGVQLGFFDYELTTWDSTPNDGVYLASTGTAIRFVAANGGAFTNGSNLTPPSDNTYFKVKIIWTDDPSNQALCYLDDILQETLTTNLPASKDLHGGARFSNDSEDSQNMDMDFIDVFYSGPLSEV